MIAQTELGTGCQVRKTDVNRKVPVWESKGISELTDLLYGHSFGIDLDEFVKCHEWNLLLLKQRVQNPPSISIVPSWRGLVGTFK